MKKLIALFTVLLFTLAAIGQNDTTRYTMVNGYGFTYNRLKAKAAIVMPADTVQNKLPGSLVVLNDSLYVRTGVKWEKIGANAAVDTVIMSTRAWRQKGDDSVSALVALRVRISDTASMLLPYLRKSDTSAMLSPYFRKGDTVTLSNRINTKLNISDTAAMLAPYAKAVAGLPIGGTTGQILAKNSATNYDVAWIDNYTTDVRETVKATESINKGQAVYVTGADGTNVLVSKASNISDATSSKTLGLLFQNLATNGQGFVIIQGRLSGLNTIGATAGDPVWLGTNGNLLYGTANKPVAPAHMVYIGVVTRVNSNNGEIFVNVQNGFELEELHNVLITDSVNNQVIAYDSTTRLWKNKTIAQALGYTPANNATTVKYSDTASMLSPYLRDADTATLSNRINLKVNISDTASMLSPYARTSNVNAALALKVNISDTSSMLTPYLRKADTTAMLSPYARTSNVNAALATKLNISDTASMLSPYLKESDTLFLSNRINLKLNISDTAAMIAPYLRKSDTTAMLTPYLRKADTLGLSNRINLKVNISDTSSMLSPYIRAAGYGLTKSGQSLLVDTAAIATRARVQKAVDSLGAGKTNGSGTLNYITKWISSSTLANSQIFDNGTNVGINTTSPGQKLDVLGNVNIGGTSWLRYENGGGYFGSATTISGGVARELGIRADSNMLFATNGANERMRIFANGRIAVNTTTDGGYQFDVNGDGRFQGTLYTRSGTNVGIQMSNTSAIRNSGSQYFDYGTGGTGDFYFRGGSGFSNYMTMLNNGNVGIGTAAPETRFAIVDGAGYRMAMRQWSGTGMEINAWNDAYQTTIPLRLNANYLTFNTGNPTSERMRINVLGYVGIATQSPLFPFQVNTYGGIDGNGNQMIIRNNIYYDNTNNRSQPIVSGYQTQIEMNNNDGTMRFSTSSASNTVGTAASITERMRIWNNGNVGINTTTDAGYKLDVNGTLRSVNGANFATASGSVGIGTASPSEKLDVSGTFDVKGIIQSTSSGTNANATLTLKTATEGTFLFQTGNAVSGGYRIYDGVAGAERLRITSTGNVGIGTNNPQTKLDVQGKLQIGEGGSLAFAGTSTVNVFKASNPRISFYDDVDHEASIGVATAGGTTYGALTFNVGQNTPERMRISSAGNIGIAVSPSAWGTNSRAIEGEFSQSWFYRNDALATGLSSNAFFNGTNWIYKTINAAQRYEIGNVGHAWFNAPVGTIGGTVSFTQAMTLNSSGNLGIGKTNPAQKLDVIGNAVFYAASGSNYVLVSSGATNSLQIATDANANYLYGTGAIPLTFSANGAERMRIHSNGRIGVNTTSDGGYQFDVNGNTRVTGKIDVTSSESIGHNIVRSGTSDIAAQIYSSNAWLLYGAESSTGGSILTGSTQYAAVVGSGYNRPLQFGTNSTVRMEIDSTGLVGINTTTPTERLDVNGRARIRTVDSTATAMNMLYVDATGVVKKTAVPGSNLTMYESTASIATSSGFTFAKDYNASTTVNYVNRIEDNTTLTANVMLQIAAYKTTSTFTTGTWQTLATIPTDYAPSSTVYFNVTDYAEGEFFTNSSGTQFTGPLEYSGQKVVRIKPSGDVDIRVQTISNSTVISGTNYVLFPITVSYQKTYVPL